MIVSDRQLASGALGGGAPLGDVVSDAAAVQALVRDPSGLIRRVLIQSEWTPDVGIDYPLRSGAPGSPPSAVVRLLKPKVTLTLAPPFRPYVIAPGGEPGRNKWALAKVGGAVVALLAVKGAWDLLRGESKQGARKGEVIVPRGWDWMWGPFKRRKNAEKRKMVILRRMKAIR